MDPGGGRGGGRGRGRLPLDEELEEWNNAIGRGRGRSAGRGTGEAGRPARIPVGDDTQGTPTATTTARPVPQRRPTVVETSQRREEFDPFVVADPEVQMERAVDVAQGRLESMALHLRGRSSSRGITSSVFHGNRSGSGSDPSSQARSATREQTQEPVAVPLVQTLSAQKHSSARVPVIQKGDKGEVVQLACNFLRLEYRQNHRIQEYHVDYDPPIDSRKLRRKAMDQFDDIIGKVRNFDGAMLFLPAMLPDKITVLTGIHPGDSDIEIKVTIVYVKEKRTEDLMLFFNILFKKIMLSLKRVELRRSYYDLESVVTLDQHKLEIWPGFCLAIEEREDGLMLCLDAAHRVLRTETVLQYMHQIRTSAENWKDTFSDFIVGKIVLTRYNNMCYKIDDVMWDINPTAKFMRGDTEVAYVDYYRTQYNSQIKDLAQPLLLSKIKPKRVAAHNIEAQQVERMVALVPELCHITGLTDDQRTNFTVMKDLGNHTRLQPADRRKALETFVKNVNTNPVAKKILTDWNLKLDDKPLYIQGRNIQGPKLNFGKSVDVAVTADYSRESTQSCHEPVNIKQYLVICTQRDADKVKRFVDMYRQVAQALGIKTLGGATILPIKGYQVNDFRRAITENLKPEFLLVVMPQQREDIYGLIKKTCVSEMGVPSQVVLTKTLSNEKRLKSVVQKIALQINCKLGGSLWSLNMPIKEQVMFVGIDVCHDAKRKHPSILAMVVNLNNECTKYYSLVRIMRVHQEITDHLESAFTEALRAYFEVRGLYPGKIIVWRDGGSIASVDFFKEHEVGQMRKAIDVLCPQALFSFVVIQKRIGQRFFQTDRRGENWKNPDPGTIIDHTVTTRYHYDFYVVPQLVRQGTVTPTHYVVVFDQANTKPDLMQKFAYVTSFMYYNWSGTIRVPAMTQYAHKLCALVGQYVRAQPGRPLVRTLYYL